VPWESAGEKALLDDRRWSWRTRLRLVAAFVEESHVREGDETQFKKERAMSKLKVDALAAGVHGSKAGEKALLDDRRWSW
jgi:hypothetical protein